jgi:uncharacterized protein (TIGR02217 family)
MSNAIFPTLAGLEYPVVRTPVFKTLSQQASSGEENRVALWSTPRWQWTLSFNFLRDDANDEFRTLTAFFLARQGSYDSFLFSDPDDNLVTGQILGTGDGAATDFQLIRNFGGYIEPILAPDSSNIAVFVNGTPTTAYNLDPGGLVQFTTPPPSDAAVTATFGYFWPCRFLEDQYDFSKFMNRLWEQKKLDFISLKNWP